MLYKYFPPNLTHVTPYLAKHRYSQLLHNVEMYYLQKKYLMTTELAQVN